MDWLFNDKVERVIMWLCAILICIVCWSQLWHVYSRHVEKELDEIRVELMSVKSTLEMNHNQLEELRQRGE